MKQYLQNQIENEDLTQSLHNLEKEKKRSEVIQQAYKLQIAYPELNNVKRGQDALEYEEDFYSQIEETRLIVIRKITNALFNSNEDYGKIDLIA